MTVREWGGKTGKGRRPVIGMLASRSPPRVAGPQSHWELGNGIKHASELPHSRDERDGVFIHQGPVKPPGRHCSLSGTSAPTV